MQYVHAITTTTTITSIVTATKAKGIKVKISGKVEGEFKLD